MKKRTAFIGAIFSLIPLGQPYLVKGCVSLVTSAFVILYDEKVNAESAQFFNNRGKAKINLEDYKGAISDFTEAIKINPKNGNAYQNRGNAKINLGDINGAVDDTNRALRISAKNNVNLSIKDILHGDDSYDPFLRGFNKLAGFDGNTYTRPITYYIHDKNEKLKSNLFSKIFKKSFAHSVDEEKFIVNLFSQIDKYIDLDFQRVSSKTNAIISIYKTNVNISENIAGLTTYSGDFRDRFFRVYIAWSDSKLDIPKLKKYPTLSVDSAYNIIHEIGHALGLTHMRLVDCGKYCKSKLDPKDLKINNTKTVMSYNNFLYPVDDIFFTQLDLKALRKKWGVEKGN